MITIEDPVCGKELDLSEVQAHEDYRGWAYFFCSDRCRRIFLTHSECFAGIEQRAGMKSSGASKKHEASHG